MNFQHWMLQLWINSFCTTHVQFNIHETCPANKEHRHALLRFFLFWMWYAITSYKMYTYVKEIHTRVILIMVHGNLEKSKNMLFIFLYRTKPRWILNLVYVYTRLRLLYHPIHEKMSTSHTFEMPFGIQYRKKVGSVIVKFRAAGGNCGSSKKPPMMLLTEHNF